MKLNPVRRRTVLRSAAAGVALVAAALVPGISAAASGPAKVKPTIVLVHGAWADGSSWSGVTERLIHDGYTVDAVPNPLRGVADDAKYVASYIAAIPGPVVLVAHSYGGFVITNAALGKANVKALVYIDAYLPDKGDSLQSLSELNGSQVGDAVITGVPSDGGKVIDTYIKQDAFPGIFANDEPRKQGTVLAATQRPLALSALGEASGDPAWKAIPSWDLIGTIDNVIPAATQKFMAERAGAEVTTIKAAHLSMISHPGAVENVIVEAARKTS